MTQQEFYKRYSYNAYTDLLGSGGFGKVFKAWDNVDDCEVALKIQPVNAQFPNLRLKNEVEIAAQYRHPNIARYKECYTFTESGGDTDIAVMSYYKDGSLDKLLKARTLTFEQSVDILMQTLDAIAYLHRNGIIHRDLKPQNILILHHNGRYIPKITDFGISKQLNGEDSSAVTNSLLGGTRYYASPEQLQATTIRKNTDLWSFGVIAYQMLTGSLPFNCGTFSPSGEDGRVELYRQMQAGILPDGIKGIAEPWQMLIRQCLVVDNNARIAHAEDCIKIISGTTVVGGGTTVGDGGAGRGGGKPSELKKRSSKRGGLWWVILLVLALLAGGGYAVVSLLDSGDEPVVEHSGVGDLLVVDHKQVFGSDGGDGTIVYALSDDGDVSKLRVKSDAEWAVIDYINEDVVEFHLLGNPHVDMRSSTITFSYGKQSFNVVVEQLGMTPDPIFKFSIATTEVANFATLCAAPFILQNPIDGATIEVSCDKAWVHSFVVRDGQIEYNVDANTSTNERSATITAKYGTLESSITVIQGGAVGFTLKQSKVEPTASGGSYSVGYTTTNGVAGASISVSDNASWITNVATSNNTVTFTVANNPSTSSRTGTITATYNGISRTISVTQKGVEAESTMSASEMFNKGNDYYHSGNYTEAVKWYRKAADQGYAGAQCNLGLCYDNGNGVTQSYTEAVKWYRKAADQGSVYAQCNLGYCYEMGNGVTQSYTEAVKWYRKAADQGHARAQSNLGYCYDKGNGVTQSYTEAVKWFRKAADQGNMYAQSNLGVYYENGRGVTQSYTEAVKWYRKAADQGDAIAQYNLGVCYGNGNGVTQSYTEAVKWYRKAADQGYASAQHNLGVCYEKGNGVTQSYGEAVNWYRKAARQGQENAQNRLRTLGETW